jgi:hypothetical protein
MAPPPDPAPAASLIRYITLAGTVCFIGAILAAVAGWAIPAFFLGTISILIAIVLFFRQLVRGIRDAL